MFFRGLWLSLIVTVFMAWWALQLLAVVIHAVVEKVIDNED